MMFSTGRSIGVMKVRSPLKTAAMYLPRYTEVGINIEKKIITMIVSE